MKQQADDLPARLGVPGSRWGGRLPRDSGSVLQMDPDDVASVGQIRHLARSRFHLAAGWR